MTDKEIIDLHMHLLGRAPDGEAAIEAFRRSAPTLILARRKIVESAEFHAFYMDVTDVTPRALADVSGVLARCLLEMVGGGRAPREAGSPNRMLHDGFRLHFRKFDTARLALVIGTLVGIRFSDILPLGTAQAAVLHVDPSFTGTLPEISRLDDGTMRFRVSAGPAQIAALLRETGHLIDVFVMLSAPAGQVWLDLLRPFLSPHLLIVLGPAIPGFHLHDISVGINDWPSSEPPVAWAGLTMFHVNGWFLPVIYTAPKTPVKLPQIGRFPKLALAATVKNEAACIEVMLKSVLPIVSFVSLVDNGSTDDTVRLAKAWLETACVPHIIRPLNADRFDVMRNRALAMVPDWVDWVLMLDADEIMVAEDFQAIFDLIARSGEDAYALPRYNYRDQNLAGEVMFYPDRQVRLLKNPRGGGMRYDGAVHERLVGGTIGNTDLDASVLGLGCGGPHIHHLVRRYRNAEDEARKQRVYRALQAKYAQDG